MITVELAAARLVLRRALINRELARVELILAARAVRAALPNKNETPALLRKQAG